MIRLGQPSRRSLAQTSRPSSPGSMRSRTISAKPLGHSPRASRHVQLWERSRPRSGHRASPFLKGFGRLGVLLRVDGAGLLAREPKPAHHARHGLGSHRLGKARLNETAQIRKGPGRGLSPVGIRPAQDAVGQDGLLGLAQPLGPVTLGAVNEPGDPFGIEALDGAAQGLAPIPAARAAWARLMPSSAFAMARSRSAVHRRFSRLAKPRRSAGVPRSVRIASARPIAASLMRRGNQKWQQLGSARVTSSGCAGIRPAVSVGRPRSQNVSRG
jgi:hypothetical protein